MLKSTFLATALGLAVTAPALAQEDATACDSLGMQTLQSQIEAEGDQATKTTATEHMQLAQTAMEGGQLDQCAVHMQEARRALGAQP